MEMEVQTAKKRRKYSKKSKKNLRKYTDIRDVEEFLEEQRFQERTGGLVSEKKNEQLFFVQKDTEGEESERTSRSLRRKKPLRSEANLRRDPVASGYPSLSRHTTQQLVAGGVPQNTSVDIGNEKEKRVAARLRSLLGGVSDSSEDEQEYDVGSRFAVKQRKEEKELVKVVSARLEKSRVKPATRDLWSDSEVTLSRNDIPDEHFLRVTRKLPVKKPASVGAKPSALDSISLPPPGASYNPTFDDHQELLRKAVDVEEGKVAADQKLNKRLVMMVPMTAGQREEVWQDEMMEGLVEEEEGAEGEGEAGEREGMLPNKRPVLAGDKKTLQQRRRERERKTKERHRLAIKALKTRMNDVYRLRSLKREIARREGEVSVKESQRLQEMREDIYRTKRLGRIPYADADIDVQLSTEISGTLRRLKCEGSIALDRYKSLQKRNIIEPRQKVRRHRKYKLKIKEKRSARLPEDTGTAKK